MNMRILNRNERRSFRCSNALYYEIEKECGDIMSVSDFVRISAFEKLCRNHPDKKDYYVSLIRGDSFEM